MSVLEVAFLGLGTMGDPMAARLVRAGHRVRGWSRTPGPRPHFDSAGGARAASAEEAAATASVVCTMLTGKEAVLSVLDAVTVTGGGKTYVDFSTIGPAAARQAARLVESRGGRFVDAPVSGTRVPAMKGTLLVLAGGAPEDVDALAPVFTAVGREVLHAGPVGAGQALKVVLNGLGCQHLVAFASMLKLGERAGLSREVLVRAFTEGAFATPAYQGKAARVLARDWTTPDFVLDLVERDARLCRDLQEEVGFTAPTHRAAHGEVRRGVALGLGADDLFGLERLYER